MQQTLRNRSTRSLESWAVTGWLCAAVAVACFSVTAFATDPTEAARMAIRLTARTSLLLFLLAFCASSLDFLWPSAATRWIKANRRSFGLAFAFSHLLHAVAIVALSQFNPVLFDELTAPAAFVAGGTAYFVIILMTLTSFDRVSEIVGARIRGIIHSGGIWFLLLSFVINFGRRAVMTPEMYWPYMALLAAAIVVRIAAHVLRRTARTLA
ncbi:MULTISPECIES: hypothetical protein [unclassified Shinella]|uniref:hypothetical protein n=2 Tax=unclassified Shinella TaxID=2643062 RepID=UPI00068BBC08|nr:MULTISPECIES: hypothetical protein [unclassified Shinella]MCA0340441.1 hypothetical protein [Pseudomonadota bacterium]MCO5151926.1 hypothetical protein [Shinella sp.]MDC7264339.1 hypothetical protein [Shinella sp. HY16]MDC7271235.1 hypothetical protein [Shinella sp. YZ44]